MGATLFEAYFFDSYIFGCKVFIKLWTLFSKSLYDAPFLRYLASKFEIYRGTVGAWV